MASNTKSVRSSAKDSLKQQEINQAVIIADNFNQKFSPLTNSKPLVLLPLVNGILLDYVLQSLEENEINETFIFCCSHNQLIRSHISASKWSHPDSPMSVTVISSSSFMSMGDIMRELDSKALIRNDFVLINGDVITTYPIGAILEEHRKQRQVDKNSAITLIYRKTLPKHKTRCKEHDFFIAVEAATQRIRYYQRINKLKTFNVPLEVFQENEEVTTHYNLLESQISICSPCVPPLFSDNFDYQSLDDFVKGLIVNEELLGNSMYIHIAKSGYGASISNLTMYDAVSQDIMSRWTYPIVPDLTDVHGQKFLHSKHNIYKTADVEIGLNCNIRQNVVLGSGTKVGKNSFLINSVIGKNCSIGENAIVKNCYIWNEVTIGDGCKLDTCLLDENVTLKCNVSVQKGCVLGAEVVIDDNITLLPFTKLQAVECADEDSFDDFGDDEKSPDKVPDAKLVGEKGHGFLCESSNESEDEDNETVEDIWGRNDEHVDESDEDEDSASSGSAELGGDEPLSEESDGGNGYDDEANFFYNEVLESLQRGIEEKVKSENMILEINSSKHAYNISMKEVNSLLIKAILKIPLESNKDIVSAQQYLATIKPSLAFFKPLICNYIRSAESQLDCLLSVQDFMRSHDNLCPAAMKVMHFWYEQDILNENVIFKWYNGLTEESGNLKKQASAFIKWLQEADEESSEESSEE